MDFSQVKLLLHCNGADASTTFTDSSSSAKTVTANGNAKIATAQSKFGGASGAFDGSGDYLTVADSADWDFGTGDFTVALWARFTAHTTTATLIGNYLNSTTGWTVQRRSDTNTLKFNNGDSTVISASWTPTNDVWYHLVACRKSGNIRLFVDGTQIGTTTASSQNITGSTSSLFVASLSSTLQPFNGYIDEVLVTTEALYDANFTAPTAPYTESPLIGSLTIAGQTPTLALGWTGTPTIGALTIAGQTPTFSGVAVLVTPGQGAVSVSGQIPSLLLGWSSTPTIGLIAVTGQQPTFINRTLTAISQQWISTTYRCILTGAPDGQTDLELPMSSFQTRMGASPFRIYLSVVVPGVDDYIDGINLRPNGKLRIDRIYNYLDGTSESFVMAVCGLETIATNQGGRSGTTGSLSGYENMAAVTAQTITLYDPITRSNDNGGRRYRCRIDPRVRPLDTVSINGESFVVDGVIHIIDPKTSIMEVQELMA